MKFIMLAVLVVAITLSAIFPKYVPMSILSGVAIGYFMARLWHKS